MKRYAMILFLSIFGLCASLAFTQESGQGSQDQSMQGMQGQQHERGERGGKRMDPQKRVQRLTKELKLNSDQQSKVRDILQDQQKQFENLRGDTSTSQQDRRSKMMELRKSTDDQVRAVLNPDQQKKFDKMQEKREQRMAGRRGHHNQGGNENQSQQPQQ
jgi:Spy/CpxP family protein refolding chaperone